RARPAGKPTERRGRGQEGTVSVPTGSSNRTERTEAQKAVQFKKGQSGNPSGRKKQDPVVKKMFEAALPDAVQLLVNTMNNENTKVELRVQCANAIIDRVMGKPQQAVQVDAKNIPQVVIVGGDKVAD
ncbi:MAG: hypothetical protein II474_05825, partial [Firmicutes bacterium]|nr:hypothetical protein [Bacillota bacterium]